ncbi:AMP-binding protein [Enterovirga sp.]|uniref:AMP-binding protein n=1 Tax=Enterovirga sp. TaxID=2026350 RepID=UPI00262502C3|nr:AMP-binding protein [Enterovirga sp.]MDB5592726.1 AMP-dependent synthetase and ligase [Enterovirga sp.]
MAVHDLTWFDLVARNGQLRPEASAVIFEGHRISHGEALARALALAAGLASAGVRKGDRVALVSANRPEMLDVAAACGRLGAILVPVNWRLSAEEIAYTLADVSPALVIAEPEHDATLRAAPAARAAAAGIYLLDGEPAPPFRRFADLAAGSPAGLPDSEVRSADPFVIIHTAAVGGTPRGAVLSHANILAHNLQLAASWQLGPQDVALAALPLFHIAGLGLAMAVQQAGGSSVLMRRFEPKAAADAIAAHGVTCLCEFAPMLSGLLDAAAAGGQDLGSLTAVWGLDAPETIARFEETCPAARFWAGYGQSETSGYVSFAPHRDRPGSAGRPSALALLEVVDEDGRAVAMGDTGEIVVRGPLVFSGYWNRPEEADNTVRAGRHHTGDMGRLDPDGYLFYAGRSPAKELIKSGGENVYPAEVERALREHPAIDAAVVIGVPDPHWGEIVKAVCVRGHGAEVSAADLIGFVGARIARFKRPKEVVFVESLPVTAAGLIDRARVKAEHGAA